VQPIQGLGSSSVKHSSQEACVKRYQTPHFFAIYREQEGIPRCHYFKRYFFPQADKDAIIIDERFNGGGQVADYYIDHLRRPFISYWATRYGEDLNTPGAAIQGPKVMLVDETAGSGGDLLPWMFHKEKLGPLVGKRTWGGLVGILGFPTLMDGGRVTAPNLFRKRLKANPSAFDSAAVRRSRGAMRRPPSWPSSGRPSTRS